MYDSCTYSHVYDKCVKDDPTIRLSPCFLPNLSHYDPIPVDCSVKDELARARAVHRKVKLAEASQGVPALATIYSTAALCPLYNALLRPFYTSIALVMRQAYAMARQEGGMFLDSTMAKVPPYLLISLCPHRLISLSPYLIISLAGETS